MLKMSTFLIITVMILLYGIIFDKKKETFYNAGKFISSKQTIQKAEKPIPQKLKWKTPFSKED